MSDKPAEPALDAHRSHAEAIQADQAAYVPPAPKPPYKPEILTDAQRQDLLAQMRATFERICAKEM